MIGYLLLTLLCVFLQAGFVLFEMACVSLNKARLQYFSDMGSARFRWLHTLMQQPSRLFGTTLIGVNAALQIGSECSRRFYESVGLDPDFAPITQLFLVVVFAELAPLFAARRHPGQIARALAPVMIWMSRIFFPLIWFFQILSSLIYRWMGKQEKESLFLSKEEVRYAFQEKEGTLESDTPMVERIFQLKQQKIENLMIPLSQIQMLSSSQRLDEVKELLLNHYVPFIPLYHRDQSNIVGIVHLRDLFRSEEDRKVTEIAKSPWFVTQDAAILDVLEQFRRNNQQIAIILDGKGASCGFLTFDQILSKIFGEKEVPLSVWGSPLSFYVERTLLGESTLQEIELQFFVRLDGSLTDTLSDWMVEKLGHPPVKGEQIRYESFLFTVLEVSFRSVKSASVQTVPV